MIIRNPNREIALIKKVLGQNQPLTRGSLAGLVKSFVTKNRRSILSIARAHATPFYLFDRQSLDANISRFIAAFARLAPKQNIFYAMKSNPYVPVLKTVVRHGLGLDVSSGTELQLAVNAGAKRIVFNGPGKTAAELGLALKHRSKVTVNLDSFAELKTLGSLAAARKQKIRAGVRLVSTTSHGAWNKFGVPLEQIETFWRTASRYQNISLEGIHFHNSWNANAAPYVETIKTIAAFLKRSPRVRRSLKFIDIGGGFWPYRVDGYYPWLLPAGEIVRTAHAAQKTAASFTDRYYLSESVPLASYAREIKQAVDKHLAPLGDYQYYVEPGRSISYPAFHIVMRIADVKGADYGIADAGTNIVGLDTYEYVYHPLINLTHFGTKEITFELFGSLCTPDDVFGHYCYATKMAAGDVIIIPNQGAYTYNTAQPFIKDVAPVLPLPNR
ncbi:MAG: hypothetical protein A2951_02015 [Candidatus Buchananbacteria bacterium RIFCSPLOWO2_01_FULL_56_15]|uniref:Orn/DAP/Arg decarboxylase 2 N-terminal domain-containing protein n=1 Tax=Candidatus Buchananbacteria bacterium RIFCSPLOWO2_01_FULL_56_15 TaxID=1797547 RepID=A0A1G1YSG2_9BACT|nr:MAG: hypothetical protein A2951_02015 [Candidatus Buchananbacteria bacterium RIFCSPLOWO2_01_FULL_56_15]